MSENWQEASGMGKTIRWREEAQSDKEAEKTVYIGAVVEGIYEDKRENIGENDSTMYMIRSADGELYSVWTTTILKDKMEKIPMGSEVRIECLGEQKAKTGGRVYTNFKVMFREAPLKDTDEISAPEEM